MTGGVITGLILAVIALMIRLRVVSDRLAATELDLDDAMEKYSKSREENLYWRGSKDLIGNYKELSDHFRTDWETKVTENAQLIAERDAYDKFRREYVEKCIRYYEDHHRQKDDQSEQPKDDNGNFSNAEGMSQERKQNIAYDYWRMEGFPTKKDDQSIYIRIGRRLGVSESTAEQYIKKYTRNHKSEYERDMAEQKQKITTLPVAE